MDRRKKLVNFHEAVTRKILRAAAEKNGAEVWPKLRIADVLNLERSGLDNDLFSFALKAHFDFVVVDQEHLPLFAVEFDGPHHDSEPRARINDMKKNAVCEKLDFPIARVRDEHLFQKARGVDYLTWLTEIFFSFQSLVEAQEKGLLPDDEPLDPMSFLSNPNIPGAFPLFISAHARSRLIALNKRGVLSAPAPLDLRGDDADGRTTCISVVTAGRGELLFATSSIYLRGFGVAPFEAAAEIAAVNLASLADEFSRTREGALSPEDVRALLVDFLRSHRATVMDGCMGCELGFSVSSQQRGGQQEWRVGALGDAPEVVIAAT